MAKEAARNAATKQEIEAKPERTEYTPELGQEIAELLAAGTPLDDTMIGENVAKLGVCAQVGVSARTIYRWQKKYPEFAEAVRESRIESSHRLADQLTHLAKIALDQPAWANACRISGDLLKSSASLRNPDAYGERKNVHISAEDEDLGERLRRSQARFREVLEEDAKPLFDRLFERIETIGSPTDDSSVKAWTLGSWNALLQDGTRLLTTDTVNVSLDATRTIKVNVGTINDFLRLATRSVEAGDSKQPSGSPKAGGLETQQPGILH